MSQGAAISGSRPPVAVAAVSACGGCVAVVLSQPLQIRSSGWVLVAGLAAAAFGTGLDCLKLSVGVMWVAHSGLSWSATRSSQGGMALCAVCRKQPRGLLAGSR